MSLSKNGLTYATNVMVLITLQLDRQTCKTRLHRRWWRWRQLTHVRHRLESRYPVPHDHEFHGRDFTTDCRDYYFSIRLIYIDGGDCC